MEISAIDAVDVRKVNVEVAGAGALVIAKLHKIADRAATARGARTQVDKDAGDIYRLIQVTRVADMATGFRTARAADVSREVTDEAVRHLEELFSRPGLPGVAMAIRAVGVGGQAPETIESVLTAYVAELFRTL
jgi:hypothetical protein